jgi:SagB-type dehydrogenase family enzyme
MGSHLILEDYVTRKRVTAGPRAVAILHLFDRWRPASTLAAHFPDDSPDALARALTELLRAGLVERSRTARDRRGDELVSWAPWSPAASYFHFSTKDAHAPIAPEDSVRTLRQRARSVPMPPAVKRYPRAPQMALPLPLTTGELPRVLLERRTWRQFSPGLIQREQLATLLGLTFGVQWWFDLHGVGRTALKTVPSGGSRHPIEAYVLALRVKGLGRGLYHYNAGDHRLELLRRGATPAQVSRYLNGQTWFGGCAALVLMTAVFARTRWKYPAPRAYRVVLIEAGHLCQTFCLVAAWLGLAPFCTMALADSIIEKDLAIDGVNESVLYTTGVGRLPAGTEWAPWHSGAHGRRTKNPRLQPRRR